MAREKATITLDRAKVRQAMTLVGEATMSDVVDVALDRLIHAERLRRDVEAYTHTPLARDELLLTGLPVRLDLDDDDVDYDLPYGEDH